MELGEVYPTEGVAKPLAISLKWRLRRSLVLVVTLVLLSLYVAGWGAALSQDQYGPEGLVRKTDFVATLTGALEIRGGNGASLYNLDVQRVAQNQVMAPYMRLGEGKMLPYNHMPFEALLVTPLMSLPYPLIFGLWTLLMVIAIGMSLWLLNRALPIDRRLLVLVVLALCSYQPLWRSLMLGQNSPLVLLGLCGAYTGLKHDRPVWAGLALLLVALKPQLLPVVLLLLLLQGRWKTLGAFAASLTALVVAVMPILGVAWPLDYAKLLLGVANWQDTGAIDPGIMHNWRGLATDLFGGWLPGLVTPFFLLMSLLSVALVAWAWWRSRGQSAQETGASGKPAGYSPRYDLLWALCGIVAVVTSLHLNPHDLTLLIFPAWVVAAYATSGRWNKRISQLWLSLLWVAYLLIPVTFYGDAANVAPGLAVVPDVLLLALAALLLARQLASPLQVARAEPVLSALF